MPVNHLDTPDLEQTINRHPLIVAPDTPLVYVITLMSQVGGSCILPDSNPALDSGGLDQARASCVLVMEGRQLVGLFTERDVVRLAAAGMSLEGVKIASVMTRHLITLKQSQFQDIFAVLNLFRQHRIRHLPIVDDQGYLVGLVTPTSVRQLLQPADLLRLRFVSEVMTPQVIHSPLTASVLHLAQMMAEHRVSCVVVTDTDTENGIQPLGIVTERDIVQFQALELDFLNIQGHTVMSTPLFCLKPQHSLWDAHQEMQRRRVHRLVVTGNRGELLGIVTQTSLLQALDPMEMYSVVDLLQQKVWQLEAEKIELLQNRNAELEKQVQERTAKLQDQAQCDRLMARVALCIRQSLNLDETLQTTVAEVRQYLQTDRVMIYRFEPDWSGVVVVESVSLNELSSLGTTIKDPCFEKAWLTRYEEGRATAIEDIYTAGLTPCHVEFLAQFQVRANLVIPILQGKHLWGLLIAHHCSGPRQWQLLDIELLKKVAIQVGIAAQQSTLFQQAQTELVERKRAQVALKKAKDELEIRVAERTAELRHTNEQLQHEIAERKQAEESLRESEEKFRNLVEQTNDWVWEIDSNTIFTYVNPRVREIVGYEPGEIIGKSIFDFMSLDEAKRFASILNFYISQREPFINLEKTLFQKEGHLVILEISGAPVFDAQGILQGYRGISRDITRRKQVEQEIRKALAKEKELSDLKSRFVSMTSHEFRTPLSIISSSAGFLEDYGHKLDEKKKLKHLHRIQSTVRHMTELLEDVLLINKAEAEKLEFNPELLDLAKFCRDLVEQVQLSIDSNHQIVLKTCGANGSNAGKYMNACMDKKLLRQILTNLLSNAVKYSPHSSAVYLELASQDGAAVFQVRDEGIGISPKDEQRLFESFHRGQNVGNIPGTGLGLAIVKKCVEVHGGQIAVTSVVGVGTTFTVKIPLNHQSKWRESLTNPV